MASEQRSLGLSLHGTMVDKLATMFKDGKYLAVARKEWVRE